MPLLCPGHQFSTAETDTTAGRPGILGEFPVVLGTWKPLVALITPNLPQINTETSLPLGLPHVGKAVASVPVEDSRA